MFRDMCNEECDCELDRGDYDMAIAEPVLFVFDIAISVQWRRPQTLRDKFALHLFELTG